MSTASYIYLPQTTRVTMSNINRLSSLYRIIHGMEKDLRLDELSRSERVVLMSVVHLKNTEGHAKTESIVEDCKDNGLSRPTIFRCLKSLSTSGKLKSEQWGYYEPSV